MSAIPLSHIVRVHHVPAQGKRVQIEANESERMELARALAVSPTLSR